MHKNYCISGTYYENPLDDYSQASLYPNFQEKYDEFKNLLINNTNNKIPTSFYKFGDGDFYFLKKQKIGSAKPGKRALRKPYWLIDHKVFIEESKKNDYYMCEIFTANRKKFETLFCRDIDFPAEYGYASIANKWLLNQFSGNIGVIGGKEKIELIFELMEYPEYQDYLGLDRFEDYLTIPQQYACDNLAKTTKNLQKQIDSSSAGIFLLGVGHVKSGLLSKLKRTNNAVFLDIGSGIDALAGIIDVARPYFGDWNNYKVKNTNFYSGIDYLKYEGKGKEITLN